VLDSAADLFHDRGFAPTTMEDIATAAGLGKSSLYHYFRSKDEILAEIHDEFVEMLIARAEDRQSAPTSAGDELRGMVVDLVELALSRPGYARTFFEPIRDLPTGLQDAFRSRREHYLAIVEQALVHGRATGEFDEAVPADVTARTIVAGCGWVHQGSRHSSPAGAVAEQVWHLVRHGIGPPS
jgi:AcrR family transcriptional regulator